MQSTHSDQVQASNERPVSMDELTAIVFQALREVAGRYEESAVNNSPSLRKTILQETRNLCQKLRPEVSVLDWDLASKALGERLID